MINKINKKNDYAFKRIFGHEKSKDILARFLSVILGVQIEEKELTLIETEIKPEYLLDKQSVLDIHVKSSKTHEKMNIEMQQAFFKDINNRVLYYWGKAFTRDLKKGQSYNTLSKQISILIADFSLFNWKSPTKYHGIFKLKEKVEDQIFSDALEIHVLELPKIKKDAENLEALECWLMYLNNVEGEKMQQIIQQEPIIQRAVSIEDMILSDEKERYFYELREKGRADFASAMACTLEEGIEKGKREGRKEGRKEEKYNIARIMLKKKLDLKDIFELTGLTIEEIKKL